MDKQWIKWAMDKQTSNADFGSCSTDANKDCDYDVTSNTGYLASTTCTEAASAAELNTCA